MNFGIIGAGQIGGTLTRKLCALGTRFASLTLVAPTR
ncbi:hypothetical protein BX589_102174 [Paraburkholderia fungorum]|jgi:Trk K+ transport system NAD-binding subunit|nr:hypothetical protein BX589_102174 [Paraburkholderia fungorum]